VTVACGQVDDVVGNNMCVLEGEGGGHEARRG
jgi:hypothetical protein